MTLVTGFAGNSFRTVCLCRFLCFKVVEQGENAIALLHTLVKLKCYLRGLVPREPLRQAATHIARSAAQGGEYGLFFFLSLLRRDHKHAGVSPVAGEAHRRDRYFVKTGIAHFRCARYRLVPRATKRLTAPTFASPYDTPFTCAECRATATGLAHLSLFAVPLQPIRRGLQSESWVCSPLCSIKLRASRPAAFRLLHAKKSKPSFL